VKQAPITFSQVLKDEYVSFHGEPFPETYLTWSFYKDHIVEPARFAIKLRDTQAENAPDNLEVNLRRNVESEAPGALEEYVQAALRQSPDVIDRATQNLPLDEDVIYPPDSLQDVIVAQLNRLLQRKNLFGYFDPDIVENALEKARAGLNKEVLIKEDLKGIELFYVNRILLEEAYPKDIFTVNNTLSGIYAQIHKKKHSALCLSGGGIRSASFGLGVIQGLARLNVLECFDYLSTVSGGGYVGSWLTAWVHRHPKKLPGVVKDLANTEPEIKIEPEPTTIRHLRTYSNYLSPKLGLLSADTWTLVSTFFRNLLLNWLVLIPLIAFIVIIPRVCSAVIEWIPAPDRIQFALRGTFITGFLSAAISIAYHGVHRPSHGSRKGQGMFLWLCLLPLLVSAVSMTTFWAWYRNPAIGSGSEQHIGLLPEGYPKLQWDELITYVAFGILLHIVAAIMAVVTILGRSFWVKLRTKKDRQAQDPHSDERHSQLSRYKFREFLLIIFTGALGGCLLYLCAVKLFPFPQGKSEYYICLAAPLYMLIYLLVVTVFAGFSSWWTDDEDREWWARLGAWVIILIMVWSVISPLVIFGPVWLQRFTYYVASIGGISSFITLLLGRSSKTTANEKEKKKSGLTSLILTKAVSFAGPICAAFIIILISMLTTLLLRWIVDKARWGNDMAFNINWRADFPAINDAPIPLGIYDHIGVLRESPAWFVLLAMVVLLGFGVLMASWVNTNKFSLHATYRNRLIRAYLGASNEKRNPNKFTGFDEADNIRMHELWPNNRSDKKRRKLLHIINMALNLVSGDNLAWQQRKAESFTVSPLHAGNFNLKYRRTEYKDDPLERKDASSEEDEKKYYGGPSGISLGTAVTISGAAASPNMGYHSSPVITFLLSLFNVRLGWWLGNTGDPGNNTYYLEAPRLAVRPIVAETLGLTDDKNPYIYLSDGGHFENLGIYEMVLRRCNFIFVSDASQDEGYTFEDLGNAVRKIRIDLGIPIDLIQPVCIFPKSDNESQNNKGRYCAIGTIKYSCTDNPIKEERNILPEDHPNKSVKDGILIYVKPAFYGSEPRDIYQYAKANAAFPHESTADQFFSESQLESYRALGSHSIEIIFKEWVKNNSYFEKFQEYYEHPEATCDYESLGEFIRIAYLKLLRESEGKCPPDQPEQSET
jgi:hypothetical protein